MNWHDGAEGGALWRFGNEPINEPLNFRIEAARFRNDPLQPLLGLLGQERVRLVHDEPARYAVAYKYYYLSLCRYFKAMSVSIRWQRGPKWLLGKRMGPRQRLVSAEHNRLEPYFELDFTNCLIHARIVCDRCIGLSRYFLTDQPVPSFTSFHKHKRFFKELVEPYEPHQEYSLYIRDNTSWFDMPLKPIRDQYFVHHGPKHMRFLGYESDHDLQMVIIPFEHPVDARIRPIIVSIRRLARDLDSFLKWFNEYAVKSFVNRT